MKFEILLVYCILPNSVEIPIIYNIYYASPALVFANFTRVSENLSINCINLHTNTHTQSILIRKQICQKYSYTEKKTKIFTKQITIAYIGKCFVHITVINMVKVYFCINARIIIRKVINAKTRNFKALDRHHHRCESRHWNGF